MISIIIPIFNSEEFLPECIDSLINQNIKNFEILLINDGSTDNSAIICDQYALRDTRIRVFHQDNGGVSSARNLGIQNALGEWICFIDSDDIVTKKFLKTFIDNITPKSSLLIQGMKRLTSNGTTELYKFNKLEYTNSSQFLDRFDIYPYFFSPCSKIYKTQIFKDFNIQYDLTKSYGEDTLLNLDYLIHCNKQIVLIPETGYYYRDTPNGLSKVGFDFKVRLALFKDIHDRLNKLTKNKSQLVPYTSFMMQALYKDPNIIDKKSYIKELLFHYKEEIIYLYSNNKFILILIQYTKLNLLNLVLKITYSNKFYLFLKSKLFK